MELQHADVLAVMAEVSAAFIGFSLAIGLLQSNQSGAKFRREAMQSVAELAMVSCAGALAVLVVKTYGLSVKETWRIGSICAAALWSVTFYWARTRYAVAGYGIRTTPTVKYAAWITVLGIGIFAINAVFPTKLAGPIHITGLFLALVDSAYLFLLSTFLVDSDESAT